MVQVPLKRRKGRNKGRISVGDVWDVDKVEELFSTVISNIMEEHLKMYNEYIGLDFIKNSTRVSVNLPLGSGEDDGPKYEFDLETLFDDRLSELSDSHLIRIRKILKKTIDTIDVYTDYAETGE